MSGIQLSGLASGLDWKTLVDQLVKARSAPVSSAASQRAKNNSKLDTLGSLKDGLLALGASLRELSSTGAFDGRTARIADGQSNWSATAAPGTQPGEYTFDVSKVATKSRLSGSSAIAMPLSESSDVGSLSLASMRTIPPVTPGFFTVNGMTIEVSQSDSLQNVFTRISEKTAGAVSARYDEQSDTVVLSSNAPIVLGSAADTSNLLSSLQLYNSSASSTVIRSRGALGSLQTSLPLAQAGLRLPVTNTDALGNGSFWINGTEISFNKNTDTIQTLLTRINASAAGVSASFEAGSGRLSLTNKVTGTLGISVRESSGGLLEALGLNSTASLQFGENAEFSLNGGATVVSTSNVLNPQVNGVPGLTVSIGGVGSQTVTVGQDQSAMRTKIEEFIAKYNKVQGLIEEQTKISVDSSGKVLTGSLASERELNEISRNLRAIVFGALPSASGATKRLADIGIDFKSGTAQLEIKDQTALTRALADNAPEVSALFNDTSGGLTTRLNSFITQTTGSGGALATTSETISKENLQLTRQIERLNGQLEKERARLTESFIQMERMQSLLQNQMRSLENAFFSKSSGNS